MKGAFVLMLAGLFNRVLGFGLRIILVRTIGDEGLGLFQRVFPIFITISIFTTMGLPVAISKFVSREASKDNYYTILQILKITFLIVFTISLFTTLGFAKYAKLIATKVLDDPRTYYILLAITPALFFTSLASILRGFFQGLRLMTPTAISQIIEQITRLLITLFLVLKLLTHSLKLQTMGAAIGVSFGEGIGLLTLIVIFLYYLPQLRSYSNPKKSKSNLKLAKELIKFGIPITLGKLITSLMYSVESINIPGNLEKLGYSLSAATSFYGQLSGMVQQLIYLPTVMTIALNSNLVPAISESIAQNNYSAIKQRANEAIRLTFYFGLLAVIILFLVPHKICDLIFSYPQAGDPLKTLATLAIFLYLSHIFGSILQGLGQPNIVVRNSIIGLAIELTLIHSIIYLPKQWGFFIISLSIGIRYLITATLNWFSINHQVRLNTSINNVFFKPLLAGSLVYLILPQSYKLIYHISQNNLISLTSSIFLSTCVYFTLLIMTNGITKEDWNRIKP
ncbi:putative polysaccharide biosynthesis protein [Halobacteroides halobius]|uniref:putative polysaccharide biosynthesis protein n=1 Tax=Halobacteroides halobius TaxID=42422 RepID=UPI002480E8DE|nr:polysaccharide biosynthesis protein [Halobacteroides halobius]